jgi:transcriptional regulator with XRE-family HTH domain
MTEITPEQSRAARALLGWSQGDLATKAEVTQKTVAEYELGNRQPYASTMGKMRGVLERAGVEFIPENGGGVGVRLKKPRRRPK